MRVKAFAAGSMSAALLVLTGCQSATVSAGTQPETNASCDIISDESLSQITGEEEIFVTGGHFDQDERDYVSCDVLSDGTPDELVRILTYDVGADEARADAEHARRGQQQTDSCAETTSLPDGAGYLCERSDRNQIDASVAMEDRLVRFSFFEGSQLEGVTPEKVSAWADDVDKRAGALDRQLETP